MCCIIENHICHFTTPEYFTGAHNILKVIDYHQNRYFQTGGQIQAFIYSAVLANSKMISSHAPFIILLWYLLPWHASLKIFCILPTKETFKKFFSKYCPNKGFTLSLKVGLFNAALVKCLSKIFVFFT